MPDFQSDFNPDAILPPLRDVIAAHDLRADKNLGQNFLLDRNITDKIARAAIEHLGDLSQTTIFEIGPGPGGLTRSLLKTNARQVIAVEFDPRAVGALASLEQAAQGRLKIIQGDALKTDLTLLATGKRAIVANLPYNIATPLLIGWLRQIHADPAAFSALFLMFQREVADRITAPAGGKAYGRLAVMAQFLTKPKRLFDLPPSVFVPPPKITSSVVRFEPLAAGPESAPFATIEKITAAAFGQRRKMLRSSLRAFDNLLESAGIDGTKRAEELPPADFIRMAKIWHARNA